MGHDFDAVVIGSGFGGAVTACRLAEAGRRVLVLERGRRWEVADYPRRPEDAWIWNQAHPERSNGWIDLRVFPHMTVVQGAAVGGGSLIYANVSVEAKPDLFNEGWPPEITATELGPYYDKVGAMLRIQKVPANQWPARTRLVKEAAEKTGHADRFGALDLAVSFDEGWSYDLEDPHHVKHSKKFTNPQGQEQGTCVHLGNCVVGCDVKAKNTLDLTYLARAEKHHAEVRPLHLVRSVAPLESGYRVFFDRIDRGRLTRGSVTARLVILSAGSLNSTEILLRCRDEYKTLPNLSRFLGRNWSANGDLLTPAFYPGREVSPSRGPTVTSAIDFLGERNQGGLHFFIEDGGFPDVLDNYLAWLSQGHAGHPYGRSLVEIIQHLLRQGGPLDSVMPWFAQGRDAADGVLRLRRKWWLFGKRVLHLAWDVEKSEKTIAAIVEMHRKLARATGGAPFVSPAWTLFRDLISPHPLGGCNLGTAPDRGVVNHMGEVFGYRNLFVADASIIPRAIGANPSKTIAALAERISSLIVADGR